MENKEVPADVMKWIKDNCPNWGGFAQKPVWKDGAIAMYYKMQDVITMVTETSEGMAQRNSELGEGIDRLKASLEESRNDAKVFQEWYKREDANVITLTEQLEIAQEERNAYERVLKELFDALDFEGKSVVAPVLDKYKKE